MSTNFDPSLGVPLSSLFFSQNNHQALAPRHHRPLAPAHTRGHGPAGRSSSSISPARRMTHFCCLNTLSTKLRPTMTERLSCPLLHPRLLAQRRSHSRQPGLLGLFVRSLIPSTVLASAVYWTRSTERSQAQPVGRWGTKAARGLCSRLRPLRLFLHSKVLLTQSSTCPQA